MTGSTRALEPTTDGPAGAPATRPGAATPALEVAAARLESGLPHQLTFIDEVLSASETGEAAPERSPNPLSVVSRLAAFQLRAGLVPTRVVDEPTALHLVRSVPDGPDRAGRICRFVADFYRIEHNGREEFLAGARVGVPVEVGGPGFGRAQEKGDVVTVTIDEGLLTPGGLDDLNRLARHLMYELTYADKSWRQRDDSPYLRFDVFFSTLFPIGTPALAQFPLEDFLLYAEQAVTCFTQLAVEDYDVYTPEKYLRIAMELWTRVARAAASARPEELPRYRELCDTASDAAPRTLKNVDETLIAQAVTAYHGAIHAIDLRSAGESSR